MKLKLLTHRHFWWDLKWKIGNFFFPKNKWLRDLIGKDYCDPKWIIENVLFGTLVYFIEEENGLDSILNLKTIDEDKEWMTQEYIDIRRRVRGEIESAYRYIKTTRPQMEMEMESLRPKLKSGVPKLSDWLIAEEDGKSYRMISCEERYGMSYQEAYGPMNDLEEEIKTLDTFYMKVIIDNRESLWT